jgi:hypothetical protein
MLHQKALFQQIVTQLCDCTRTHSGDSGELCARKLLMLQQSGNGRRFYRPEEGSFRCFIQTVILNNPTYSTSGFVKTCKRTRTTQKRIRFAAGKVAALIIRRSHFMPLFVRNNNNTVSEIKSPKGYGTKE